MNKESSFKEWLKPEILNQTVRTAALIVAATWAVFLYFKHDRLQLESALAIARTELESKQVELEVDQSPRPKIKQEMQILSLATSHSAKNRYHIEYDYSFSNMSKKPLYVVFVEIQFYLLELGALGQEGFVQIPWFEGNKLIQWRELISNGYSLREWAESPESGASEFIRLHGRIESYQPSGGGTAKLDFGETAAGSIDLILEAQESDFVGARLRFGALTRDKNDESYGKLEEKDLWVVKYKKSLATSQRRSG